MNTFEITGDLNTTGEKLKQKWSQFTGDDFQELTDETPEAVEIFAGEISPCCCN